MQSSNKIIRRSVEISPEKSPSSCSKTEKVILLKPFGNQVSGRANILTYNSTTICKPYVSRELFFYYYLPPAFRKFVPGFKGLIGVSYLDSGSDDAVVAFTNPKSLLKKNSQAIRSLVEVPRPHSKRCVQDYGKTHVIAPSSPVIAGLRPKPGSGVEFSSAPDSEVDRLSQGFDASVSIQTFDGRECRVEWRSVKSEDPRSQANPWNTKIMADVWTKIKNVQKENGGLASKTKRFMLLENVSASYRRPCILDLKVGTRVRETASLAKLARHVTAIDVGVRMSGMQIYNADRKEFVYVNKYYGHNLSVEGLVSNLVDFFSRGRSSLVRLAGGVPAGGEGEGGVKPALTSTLGHLDLGLLDSAVVQLKALRRAVSGLTSYRFYSGSLLLIYEGENLVALKSKTIDQGKAAEGVANAKKCENRARSGERKQTAPRPSSYPSAPGLSRPSTCDAPLTTSVFPQRPHTTVSVSQKKPNTVASSSETPGRRRQRTKSCGSFSNSHEPGSVAPPCESSIDVRLIDFAHFCYNDSAIHPGPDGGFLFGIDNLVDILEKMVAK